MVMAGDRAQAGEVFRYIRGLLESVPRFAAMRSIVRRDTGERYQEFLTRLAAASGIKTPTREALARLDAVRTAHLFNGRARVVKSATSTTGC